MGDGRQRPPAYTPLMQRPDTIDSRTILRVYQIVATVGGFAIVAYRWPMPDILSRTPVNPANLWSLTLMVAATIVWLSAAAAAGFARIEDLRVRGRVVRVFAGVLLIGGSLYWAPAFPIIRV